MKDTKEIREIATSFLMHEGKILIVRRARSDTYPGKWGAISGGIELGEHDPLDAAVREIGEETGLLPQDIKLVRRGEAYVIPDAMHHLTFLAYPFLFEIGAGAVSRIRLNKENDRLVWIDPADLQEYDTILDLYKAVEKVFSVDAVKPRKGKAT